jgi:23S rRNA (cytosine1962-C5)-methyltransferase
MTTTPPGLSNALPALRLKKREERRILAGHQWVFSNEVDTAQTPLNRFEPGALCRVVSSRDQFLGWAYVNPHALICARILARDSVNLEESGISELFAARLRDALALRERIYDRPFYRLVHGESDRLPGLVIERFGDLVVGQVGTAGMEALRGPIAEAVREVVAPSAMLWKNDSGARGLEGLPSYVEPAFGDVPEAVELEESGVRFMVPVRSGQKTGWFFDQARNRAALLPYVRGARVLDVFCYLGAWGLGAARAGAAAVTCVDASASALEAVAAAARPNDLEVATRQGDAFDVLEALRQDGDRFDVVVIDPPAFIKRKKDIPKGEAAYRKLNQLATELVEPGGLLVSCSCSWHLRAESLVDAIQHGARRTGRFAQIIEVGGQAPDHPIHPAIPETNYLKAFTARILAD